MNERIQKFEKQCWDNQTNHLDTEKFAESIIQECIEQIQLSTARDPQYTPQYRQSVGHIHRIRKHFGVE